MADNHPPVQCTESDGQYHYKNWSHRFTCGLCGRSGRFSNNFLGSRLVICTGAGTFTKVKPGRVEFEQAGIDVDRFVAANPQSHALRWLEKEPTER